MELNDLIALMAASIYAVGPRQNTPAVNAADSAVREAHEIWKAVLRHDRAQRGDQ